MGGIKGCFGPEDQACLYSYSLSARIRMSTNEQECVTKNNNHETEVFLQRNHHDDSHAAISGAYEGAEPGDVVSGDANDVRLVR